jgi:LCP family protein required for cell wall assembly
MAGHRLVQHPRAQWLILALALLALLATFAANAFAQEAGSGTVPPGTTDLAQQAPRVSGPVIQFDGDRLEVSRLPAGTVALTFDDGPDPMWTPRILDALRRHRAKGTFFVVGSHVNRHPDVVRRIVAEGHELGLHGFTHRDLLSLPTWQRRLEFELTRNAVARAVGTDIRLFRPPYLASAARVDERAMALIKDAGRSGYVTVLADRDTGDWRRPGAPAITSAATPAGNRGTIVLMHDGGGRRDQTVAALDALLPALTRNGLRPVTVSDALRELPPAIPAAPDTVRQGQVFAFVQRTAAHVSGSMFYLMLLAALLALVRMAIQAIGAAKHHRRRRGRLPPYRPPISVLVPAHNEAANIVATIESLLANPYPKVEIIVVDDGSTDGTADLVAGMGRPEVRVLRRANAGKAAALRAGVAAARYDVLVLIDGDTVVEPDTLDLLARQFRNPKIGAVAGNVKVANRGGIIGRWQHLEYVVAFNLDRRVYDVARCMPTVPGALGAYRRAAIVDAGGVSGDTQAEDTDLTMAICRAGWRVVYEPDACAWTEAPSTLRGWWRQRSRWSYGTMQAIWKHRGALFRLGPAGRLGRRGIGYIATFQIMQPLLAPLADVFLISSVLFEAPTIAILLWLVLHMAQLAVAAYAFRLDREPLGPLWVLPTQQFVYRQLTYLVTIQSLVTALLGTRLRWSRTARAGWAAAVAQHGGATNVAAARVRELVRLIRLGKYRDPLWARLCVRAGVTLMVLSLVAAGVGAGLARRYEESIRQEDLLGTAASYAGRPDSWSLDRPLNLLLIGVDWRKGQPGIIRADTVMVVHVPRSRDQAFLFSVPRDTLVDIPAAMAAGFRGGRDRINSSFGYGAGLEQDRARGGRLLAETVKNLTGLPGFDAAALIDFYGFTDVVNVLGAVRICVDATVRSIHTKAVFRKGCHRLNGRSALDYLRQRKSVAGSDYGRQRHQQQFIRSMAAEAKRQNLTGNPAKLDRLFRAAGSALTVTTGPSPVFELLFAFRKIDPTRITIIRTPGHGVRDASGRYLGERLEPVAHELFKATRENRLERFVAAHPELVSQAPTTSP